MISMVIHGGAWNIPDSLLDAHRNGCAAAIGKGWNILSSGGTAIDAVEQAVRVMEADGTFDAGRGAHLNADGHVELDASIMEGHSYRCGAVAAVRRVMHPITLARKIMEESEHILLVGQGAERFAVSAGIRLCRESELVTDRERALWKSVNAKSGFRSKHAFSKHPGDTVGAVAVDRSGNICVGTSTGGTLNKYPGRVGDSPLIGCGSYAENGIGGVSTTGWGEGMIKVVLAKTVIDHMDANEKDPQKAAEFGIDLLHKKVDGRGGVIVLNYEGRVGVSFSTPRMAFACMTEEMNEPRVEA
ncbi:MAG TPA: isoaspartyl peptidase/L-asparaginase [Bacteroidota bacterium]|nr:isoaspartyl peptidase/L-asparaginase [Bacteroidota bacterium]